MMSRCQIERTGLSMKGTTGKHQCFTPIGAIGSGKTEIKKRQNYPVSPLLRTVLPCLFPPSFPNTFLSTGRKASEIGRALSQDQISI